MRVGVCVEVGWFKQPHRPGLAGLWLHTRRVSSVPALNQLPPHTLRVRSAGRCCSRCHVQCQTSNKPGAGSEDLRAKARPDWRI